MEKIWDRKWANRKANRKMLLSKKSWLIEEGLVTTYQKCALEFGEFWKKVQQSLFVDRRVFVI